MQLEFLVLGDVQARMGGARVNLGHARQRCVLAALLVDADRPVDLDRLIDRIWADRAPIRAQQVVYSYLSRLRAALAPAGARIDRSPAGYVLAVDPMSVDLHRFRQMVGRSREATGDRVRAGLLEQALTLWRGPAFGALDTPWLSIIRDGLERERAAAELDLNDLTLRRGGHADLLASLVTAVAASPLNERLTGQLMLTLYRCGRQGDALEEHRRLRSRLAQELGVDPSPEIQRLHQRILAHDEELAAPAGVVGQPRAPRPRDTLLDRISAAPLILTNLPARNPHFAGRWAVLEEIHRGLRQGGRSGTPCLEALYGLGGVGKTQLALEYAHRCAADYDVTWWVDAEQVVLIPGQFTALAAELGLPVAASAADTVQRVLTDLARRSRWLIIFDNAEKPSDIADYRPAGDGHVVVTSRFPGWSALGHRLQIDVLDRADTIALLLARTSTLSPEIADELAAELGDLPLAAAQAAAYLEQTDLPPTDYLRRLRNRRVSDVLARGDAFDYRRRLDTTWSLSLDRLSCDSPAAVALLEASAFLSPEPIPLALFTAHPALLQQPVRGAATDPDVLTDAVGAMISYSLARRHPGAFQVHRLVQAVIRDRLSNSRRHELVGMLIGLLTATQPADPHDPTTWAAHTQYAGHILALGPFMDGDPQGRQLMLATTLAFYLRGDSVGCRHVADELYKRWRRILGPDHPDTLAAATHRTAALAD